jgi:arabinogalactan endo-1,4-beta-galactosidase
VRDEGDRVLIGESIYGGEDPSNFALAMAITSHKSGENIAVQGDVSFIKDALHALHDFNREYGMSRFEPTREDQRLYLEYLQDNETSEVQATRDVAADNPSTSHAAGPSPRP